MEELTPLNSLERDWVDEQMAHPIFQKALKLIHVQRPGVFPTDGFGVTPEQQRKKECDRLYEIRGWKMFKAALLNVTQVVAPKKPPQDMPEETYPNEEPENKQTEN